jgi:hypothetical protein
VVWQATIVQFEYLEPEQIGHLIPYQYEIKLSPGLDFLKTNLNEILNNLLKILNFRPTSESHNTFAFLNQINN